MKTYNNKLSLNWQETGLSGGDSPDMSQKAESPESDEMKRSAHSTGGNSLKGIIE